MTARGAFPGRYPGIFANLAKLFAIVSHSLETSSGGSSIFNVETDSGFFSTCTFMGSHATTRQHIRKLLGGDSVSVDLRFAASQNAAQSTNLSSFQVNRV